MEEAKQPMECRNLCQILYTKKFKDNWNFGGQILFMKVLIYMKECICSQEMQVEVCGTKIHCFNFQTAWKANTYTQAHTHASTQN